MCKKLCYALIIFVVLCVGCTTTERPVKFKDIEWIEE